MKTEITPNEHIDLIRLVREQQIKLKKKNEDLSRARLRLNKARGNIQRLKEIVAFQRARILELHGSPTSEKQTQLSKQQ